MRKLLGLVAGLMLVASTVFAQANNTAGGVVYLVPPTTLNYDITVALTPATTTRTFFSKVRLTGVGNDTSAAISGGSFEFEHAGTANATGSIGTAGLFRAHASSSGYIPTLTGVQGSSTLDGTFTGADTALYGGRFTASNTATAALNVIDIYGVFGGVYASGDPGGTTSEAFAFQAQCDISTTTVGHNCYGMSMLTLNAGTGGTVFAYHVPNGVMTGAAQYAFYNGDLDAPVYSASNVLTPLYASSAVGTALTVSSNVITPTHTLHHLGAGLVKTITVPAMCTPTCFIQIVPDSAYTYDATGNIVVPAGSGTAVVNKLMIFAWDGTKWYPSY